MPTKQSPKHIAVAGNIGAGKTTLTAMLARHYGWAPHYEDVEHNPYLADDDDAIRKKVMKAKTDSGPTAPNTPMPDYVEGLFSLMQLVSTPEVTASFRKHYDEATIRYGDMKKQLAEDMVKFITPIREKAEVIFNDKTYLKNLMAEGAIKARASAQKTIEDVRELTGFNYYK